MGKLTTLEGELLSALILAEEHLEYCGYGDSWESECARDSGLAKTITKAITKAEAKENE